MDKFFTTVNQTGSPATGVNPQMTQFLASNGVLTPNGDPLNTSLSTKQYAGGDFGKFWSMVFPTGKTACDLQAAINNIQAKVAQFAGMINGNANSWVQANIKNGGGCAGCQGDAAAYIMNSWRTLQSMLTQYQSLYSQNVAKEGGGCPPSGVCCTTKCTTIPPCTTTKTSASGAATVTAPNTASSISPMTIGLIVGGVLFVGIVAILLIKGKAAVPIPAPAAS